MSKVVNGPELTEVFTNQIGFKSIAGGVKVQLPARWPQDAQPPTTSSLLSIASTKGLLAAGGPDALIVVSTDRVRAAYKDAASKNEVVQLQPDLSIPCPRLSHVSFTSDNTCLIVAAESGGGLAAHATEALKANHKEPIFELSTEGVAVRALAPNPATELAHFVAVLLENGHLMLANFQERTFVRTSSGASLKDNVTSVAWSVRGKQLVAGLSDGTAVQLDPQGTIKASIPRPPATEAGSCVSNIVWLANDDFLMFHSLSSPGQDTVLHWVKRDKERNTLEFRKSSNDPCFSSQSRVPSAYFTSRIRKWSTLEDLVILSSPLSSDVVFLTNSKVSMQFQGDTDGTTDVYALTTLEDDTRKAILPMSTTEPMDETYPVGQAIDLSSKEKVWQPIPGDDTVADTTPFPLPALAILNNEGLLSYWWFVNDTALRQSAGEEIPYPGLVHPNNIANPSISGSNAPAATSSQTIASPFSQSFAPAKPAFGTSTLPKPAQPSFGSPSFVSPAPTTGPKPTFGQSTFGKPAFGASPAFGSPSPWGSSVSAGNTTNTTSTQAFGKPAFGAVTAPAPGFGQAANLGQASPWGTSANPSSNAAPKTPFGGNAAGASGFAKFASNQNSAFGAVANPNVTSPFASASAAKASPFGSLTKEPSFNQTSQQSFGSTVTMSSTTGGSTVGNQSLFGSTAFGTPTAPKGLFGQASSFSTQMSAAKKDEDMSDDATPQVKPADRNSISTSILGGKTPFSITSSFQPAQSARERDDFNSQTDAKDSSFGLGSLGSNLQDSSMEVKPDPALPTKSLFDIPIKETTETATKDTDQSAQPAPPDVVSKPAPSSSSGTFSGDSSTVIKTTEIDELPSSPPESENEGIQAEDEDDDAGLEIENDDDAEKDIDDADSEHHSDGVATPARIEQLTQNTIVNETTPLSGKSASTTPLDNTPLVPKSVMNLKGHPFGHSQNSESSEVPPPAPTPPISGPVPLFPSLGSSTTPAGVPAAPLFAPPKPQESPRSPSPVRRSGPAVTQPAQITVVPQPPVTSRATELSSTSPSSSLHINAKRGRILSDLHDDRDEAVRIDLSKPLEPTTDLPPFVAHIDYAGRLGLEDVAGNVERVYRDINSMIDTAGQNARALASFVTGHQEESETNPEGTDINDATLAWTFDDIDRLRSLEHNLARRIMQDSVLNINDIRTEISEVKRRIRPAKEDQKKMKAFLHAYKDPAAHNKRRHAPLDPDAAARQRDLMNQLAIFRKALAEAEDKATLVKAKLASRGPAKQVPTVEAVEKTIRKMTAMVQRRSMEVDYLESQMRKLGIANSTKAGGTRTSPAKGRTLGTIVKTDANNDHDEESAWRVQRTIEVRAKRRAILNKIRDELEKKHAVSS